MINVLTLMRRQNGQRRGCGEICTFYGACLPLQKSPTCCAADYFKAGCHTRAETAAHPIASRASLCVQPVEPAGAAFHLHAFGPLLRCRHPNALATQSSRRIIRAYVQHTNTGPRKKIWSKPLMLKGQSVCFSCFFVFFLSAFSAYVSSACILCAAQEI